MIGTWGYQYFVVGLAFGQIEVDLQNQLRQRPAGVANLVHLTIEVGNPLIRQIYAKCEEVLKLADGQDLGSLYGNVEALKAKIIIAQKQAGGRLSVNDIANDVMRLKNDFFYTLHKRLFYSVQPEFSQFYGKVELFGSEVASKFKDARDDIERAGNCLALGESTACVLHLMRALEVIIRHLGKKLRVTINPKDTWGTILKNMDHGIERLPEKTGMQKRKKGRWSECRTNLWHLKQAFRDDFMHGKQSYDEKQARQIFDRCDVFTQHLATL